MERNAQAEQNRPQGIRKCFDDLRRGREPQSVPLEERERVRDGDPRVIDDRHIEVSDMPAERRGKEDEEQDGTPILGISSPERVRPHWHPLLENGVDGHSQKSQAFALLTHS